MIIDNEFYRAIDELNEIYRQNSAAFAAAWAKEIDREMVELYRGRPVITEEMAERLPCPLPDDSEL